MSKENKFKNTLKFIKLYSSRNFFSTYIKQIAKKKNNLNEFEIILERTKNILNENNTQLYFVYLPSYDHLKYSFNDKNLNSIKNILKKLDITLIDINKEIFDKNNDKLGFFPFRMKGHYTVDGYRQIGNKIFELTR